MSKLTGYELSRDWFNFAFENIAEVSSHDTALYMWLIELNNRLGWIHEFQVTSIENMHAMSCKNYRTYKKSFDNLIKWGFIRVIKKSTNQYQCNIIALARNTKPNTKALDKALAKASPKARPIFIKHINS